MAATAAVQKFHHVEEIRDWKEYRTKQNIIASR
jgi:hypothetical protein